jgi:hypothetical protein
VDLLDAGAALIPNGEGHGFFSVGQGLVARHAVSPLIVPPGDVTVTTVITTELKFEPTTIEPLRLDPSGDSPPVQPRDKSASRRALTLDVDSAAGESTAGSGPELLEVSIHAAAEAATPAPRPLSPPAPASHEGAAAGSVAPLSLGSTEAALAATDVITMNGVFTRTEQTDPTINYTGTWNSRSLSRASGGTYFRADGAGNAAEFSFSGSPVRVGFVGNRYSGDARVSIDGVDQGVLDLNRRYEADISFVYDGLITGTHTISVTALGTSNPWSQNDYVRLDYFDVWKEAPLLHGTFQQDDPRIIRSNSWHNLDNPTANGGSFQYSNQGTLWFPFYGDSFTYHLVGRGETARAGYMWTGCTLPR